jgi:hypothetical protein
MAAPVASWGPAAAAADSLTHSAPLRRSCWIHQDAVVVIVVIVVDDIGVSSVISLMSSASALSFEWLSASEFIL